MIGERQKCDMSKPTHFESNLSKIGLNCPIPVLKNNISAVDTNPHLTANR